MFTQGALSSIGESLITTLILSWIHRVGAGARAGYTIMPSELG
jgi:hypothetical protein